MRLKRFLIETVTLLVVAVLCALVSNLLAGRERKLNLVPDTLPAAGAGAPKPATQPTPPPVSPEATTSSPPVTSGVPDSGASAVAPAPGELTAKYPPHDQPSKDVHGDDVEWLHARGALVIDARRTSVYQAGHIAGAVSIPVWEADVNERINNLLNEGRDPKQPLVIYCAGGECEDSHLLSEKLYGVGFSNILIYKDGWPDWQKRKGPSRTGAS